MNESRLKELIEQVIAAESRLRAAYGYPPPDVRPGASGEDAIKSFERKIGKRIPPSYRTFLRLHDGVDGLWSDFSLIGTSGQRNTVLLNRIQMIVRIDTDGTEPVLASPEDIRKYEGSGQFYLPDHFVFGTDMGRALLLYNSNTRKEDGEMAVVLWRADEFPHPVFKDFETFLEACLKLQTAELDSLPQRSSPKEAPKEKGKATKRPQKSKRAPATNKGSVKKSSSAAKAKKRRKR